MRKQLQLLLVVPAVLVFAVGFYFYFPTIFGDDLYPLDYVTEINQCADIFGLDKPLLAALILKESGYNPRAVSRAGAMGLTQVMPATFRGVISRVPELQGKIGTDPFDPKTNICAGAAVLAGNMANYNGSWEAALIAYNGGDGAARRYLAARSTSVLVTETRTYAPKILAAREVYATMYADKLPSSGPGQTSGGGGGGAVATPKPIALAVQKPSEKVSAFWKGFLKDAFAQYINK